MSSIEPDGSVAIGSDLPPAAAAGTAPPRRPPRSRVDADAEKAALACLRDGQPREALRILMTAYGAPIAAFALRILRDRELAKDVRQHVFVQAFLHFDTFEGRGTLWGWLCSITTRRCLDELRRSRRLEVTDDLDVSEGLADPSGSSMDPDRVAKQRALEHCLGELPDLMRTQLLMRCFLGLSYAEISEQVGDAPGTVQVRISRILPRLRRCLCKKGVIR